jgi:ribosome-binding protein aMBF1 (putative translation factor)
VGLTRIIISIGRKLTFRRFDALPARDAEQSERLIQRDLGTLAAGSTGPAARDSAPGSHESTSTRCDGVKVARIREAFGLSQQEVADRANLSYSAVARIEDGLMVFTPTVQAVAAVLGLSIADMRHPEDLGSKSRSTNIQ